MRCVVLSSLLAAASACGGTAAHRSSSPPPPAEPHGSTGSASGAGAAGAGSRADTEFLRDYVATRGFTLGTPTTPRLTRDGSTVVFARAKPRDPSMSLYAFDVASGQTRELVTPEKLLGGSDEQLSPEERARRERQRQKFSGFTGFEIAPDGRSVVAMLSGRVYSIALDGTRVVPVVGPDAHGAAPFDARLSPDGGRVGFVRGGELWVAPVKENAPAVPITRGSGGDIQHAQAEFVAQEEMGRHQGWWWSPDGTQLVYQRNDASAVEKVWQADPSEPFAPVTASPYPRPGHANVDVRLGITPAVGAAGAAGARTTWIEWDRARYPYLARVRWDEHAPLTIVVLSRDQRDLALLAVDAKNGKTRELLHEHDDRFLNLSDEYMWLRDGSGFLWPSERGGGWQLELHAPDGKLVRVLTPLELGFRDVAWVDPKGTSVIVHGGAEPVDDLLWRVSLTSEAAPERLSETDVGTTAVYARDGLVHVRMHNSESVDHAIEVVRADGSSAGVLPGVVEAVPTPPKLQVVRAGTGRGFWGVIVRPSTFDPGKKYPVLVNVYGGPHGRMVKRERRAYVLQQWIADHGYIVVSIDNRGTPGRGRDWERAIYGKFAEVPLTDQVDGLRALAASEPAMDLSRVGIWGSSFGGFMSALAVLRRPDVFKAGIAIAPVANWLDYDTCYTERYLGVPDLKDTSAYDANGLIMYAPELTRPLLIMHGTADDNVHFSHAIDLADALLRAGKPFEFVPLARQTHSPREPELLARYYERIFRFFAASL